MSTPQHPASRADRMFHVSMKAPAPTRKIAPTQKPKYVVSYQRLGSSNWQHVEDPFTTSKQAALKKLNQYVDSPLAYYRHCAFQVKRLSDQFIIIRKEHK